MILAKSTIVILLFLSLSQLILADYSPADAKEFASASALAYCTPDAIQSWTCGAPCKNLTGYQAYYTHVFDVTSSETLSFSMIYNPSTKRFVTSFRGTAGTAELLLEIAEGGALKYALSSLPGAYADDYFYTHYANNLRDAFIDNIKKAYAEFPDFNFIFTGHSLGGAITTLASYDAVTQGIIPSKQATLYNYGSPRVGNQVFADAVQSAIPEIYRVVHWKDMVPHVPPCIMNLKGECVPSGLSPDPSVLPLTWHAWHIQPQIFYDEANVEYSVCNAEEPSCADQFSLTGSSVNDHGFYVGIKLACGGTTAFLYPPLYPETDNSDDTQILQ